MGAEEEMEIEVPVEELAKEGITSEIVASVTLRRWVNNSII